MPGVDAALPQRDGSKGIAGMGLGKIRVQREGAAIGGKHGAQLIVPDGGQTLRLGAQVVIIGREIAGGNAFSGGDGLSVRRGLNGRIAGAHAPEPHADGENDCHGDDRAKDMPQPAFRHGRCGKGSRCRAEFGRRQRGWRRAPDLRRGARHQRGRVDPKFSLQAAAKPLVLIPSFAVPARFLQRPDQAGMEGLVKGVDDGERPVASV